MSEISNSLGNAVPQGNITFEGKEYKVSLLSLEKLEDFSRWIYSKAISNLRLLKDELTSEEYMSRLNTLTSNYENNVYDISGEIAGKILKTITGSVKLLSMILNMDTDCAFRYSSSHPEEVTCLINDIMRRSFPESPKANPPVS